VIGVHHLLLFIVSGLLLNLTPGQDTLFIVGRTVSQGRRAGLLSVLGISSGSVIHTLAAAFGLRRFSPRRRWPSPSSSSPARCIWCISASG
jgi:threonine/homoserine/homoserine lactone efflux protein